MRFHTLSSSVSSSASRQVDTCTVQTVERSNKLFCGFIRLKSLEAKQFVFRSTVNTRHSPNVGYIYIHPSISISIYIKTHELFSQLHLWTFGCLFHSLHLVCPHRLILQTMWKGLWGLQCDTNNVIPIAVNGCSPSILVLAPLSLAVAQLAHSPAMRLLSIEWTEVQLGNSSSPETHWKAFLLKINPMRPRPASQPRRPRAACQLASPSPLIHCSVPFMQKPSYGCAQAGAGAFKPSATCSFT